MIADVAGALAALRRNFPGWGILYDPFTPRWVALRGRTITLVAESPERLRADLERG